MGLSINRQNTMGSGSVSECNCISPVYPLLATSPLEMQRWSRWRVHCYPRPRCMDGRSTISHSSLGLGSIGKTQLVIAYTLKYQERYSAVLWLKDNSKDTLLQSLTAFATYMQVSTVCRSRRSRSPNTAKKQRRARMLFFDGSSSSTTPIDTILQWLKTL